MPSSAPTTDILMDLLDILLRLDTSTIDMFEDRSGPQYRAALWLADEDTYWWMGNTLSLEDPKVTQRFALATFYYSTGGNDWKQCGRDSREEFDGVAWLNG
jgi:hypothetical protein